MASREYSSTDTGAPQMGGNAAGSLLGVLRAVLVDGYGDKQPLGWELMFVDAVNHIHVYRPRSGSRMFLKIVDDGTIRYSSIFRAAFMSYENMFSANQGIHPCPPEQNYRNGQAGYVIKTGENNTTAQKWKIIGDEEGFYLITFPYSSKATNYNSVGCWFYFGDYPCFGYDTNKNMYNWVMMTAQNDGYSRSSGHNSTGVACIMRNPYTQVKGCRGIYIGSLFGQGERNTHNAIYVATQDASGRFVNNLANINGLPVYSPVYIRDQAYTTNILGVLPGMFDIICTNSYKQNQIYYEELDENNKLVCVPVAPAINYVQQDHCRIAFLIGEKFRYVF